MASLGRSAKVSKTQAQRAERRLSGKTVPAATRAAQSVCVCIARPPLGLKACCQLLLAYYPRFAPLPQLTEVVGNDQPFEAAFHARMAMGRLDGTPRTARQLSVYQH